MRKFQAALFALVASAALATAAHAQSDDDGTQGYGSIGYQTGDFGDLGKGLNALSLSGALNLSKYFGVEGDLGVGVGDKTTDFMGTSAKARLDNDMGLYAVGSFPVSKDIDLFARAGFLEAKVKATATGFEGEQQYSGPAIGVGAHYFPGGGKNGVALELNYADFGHNGKTDIAQLSFVHRF